LRHLHYLLVKELIMPFDLLGALNPLYSEFNGDDGDRTHNLRLAKPALSQLSYVPEPN
jgi:hypothetical protein